METANTKKCKKCGQVRSVKCYGKSTSNKDRLQSHCKICQNGLTQRLVKRYDKDGVLIGGLVLWFGQRLSKSSVNWLRSKGLKYCGCCGVVKPLEAFASNGRCKECQAAGERAYDQTEKGKARKKAYEQSEKGKTAIKVRDHNRRAMKKALPHDITADDLKTVSEVFHGHCAYTGKPIEEHHDDHVIPLGVGYGGSIVSNMVPAEASINESKKAKNVFEFVDSLETQGVNTTYFYDVTLPYIVEEYREYIEDEDLYTEEYVEYVNYCHDNPRTVEEVEAENKRN